MLGDFVDDYTVKVVDVFAMPQSGTGVSVEAVDPVFQMKMLEMLKQVRLCLVALCCSCSAGSGDATRIYAALDFALVSNSQVQAASRHQTLHVATAKCMVLQGAAAHCPCAFLLCQHATSCSTLGHANCVHVSVRA